MSSPLTRPANRFPLCSKLSPFVSQRVGFFLAHLNHADLDYLRDLLQTGKVTPVIDRRYRLSETSEAIRYLEAGHARGKVIIDVE